MNAHPDSLTFDEFCAAPMSYRLGMRGERGASRLYRNDDLGIQKETHTKFDPRRWEWHHPTVAYFLDGDPREFKNVAELYVAWMARLHGVIAEDCE